MQADEVQAVKQIVKKTAHQLTKQLKEEEDKRMKADEQEIKTKCLRTRHANEPNGWKKKRPSVGKKGHKVKQNAKEACCTPATN
jgi:hypothetical protein